MKQLKDYYWGQNIYRIRQHILHDKPYNELFVRHFTGGFVSILVGTALLNTPLITNGKKLQR